MVKENPDFGVLISHTRSLEGICQTRQAGKKRGGPGAVQGNFTEVHSKRVSGSNPRTQFARKGKGFEEGLGKTFPAKGAVHKDEKWGSVCGLEKDRGGERRGIRCVPVHFSTGTRKRKNLH